MAYWEASAEEILGKLAQISWDYDEAKKEVVGITLIDLRARLLGELDHDDQVDEN